MSEIKKENVPEEKPGKTSTTKQPLLIGGAILLLMLLLGAAIFGTQYFSKPSKQTAIKKETKKITSSTDILRARRVTVDPLKATSLQVYADNRMVIRLDIPQGAIKKTTIVTLTPYKDADNNLQVQISPASLKFMKPLTLTYDLSRTHLRTDAPKTVAKSLRKIGKSQLLQVDTSTKIVQLISRPTETTTSVTGRILSGGTFQLVLQPDNQEVFARSTLKDTKSNSLNVLEAASEIFYNHQQLSSNEKNRVQQSIDKVLAISNPATYELFPAILLQKDLKSQASLFIREAFAADITAGYFEFRCKDKTLSVEEYVVAAQSAQALGHDDIGEKCLDAAKNRVADDARKVLAQNPPAVSEIIRMMAKVQMFGLDKLDADLQNKLDEVVKQNIDQTLKDPNATLEDTIKALQDAQVTGADKTYEDQLTQQIKDLGTKDVTAVLNDPQSNMIDVAKAVQKAQALGLDAIANQGLDKLKQMSNRSSEEILNNPNSSAKELQDALAQASTEGKDQAYKDAIRQKIKDAQNKESQPQPSPSPKVGDNQENLDPGFDMSVLGLGFLQMMGLQSFDESSIKNFVQEKTDQSNELLDMAPELCAEMRQYASDFPDLMKNCDYLTGGQARSDVQKAHDDGFNAASEVGNVQSSDYETPDYNDDHMEIEITPTDEPTQGEDTNTDTITPDDTEVQNNDSTSDNQQSDTQSGDEQVQGAHTKRGLH